MSNIRINAAAVATAACLTMGLAGSASAQSGGEIPRMSDGHPDMSGIWWTGGDLGSPGFNSAGRSGGGGRGGQADAPAPPRYEDLLQDWARDRAATMGDKDDPTLQCRSTAFGTLNVRLFDVGTLGQIIAQPDMFTFLTETFHGYQQIPTDGRPHRDYVPPSYRGDSVGHWEGDTFVVETTNFTDDTWLYAEGRVSFHSDAMRIDERYRLVDANTMLIDATITDPKVLTAPLVVPTQRLVRSPDDQLLPLICASVETKAVMDAAAAVK